MRFLLFCIFISTQFLPVAKANYVAIESAQNNPGELTAELLPATSKDMLVLLHGCAQQGRGFAEASGFEHLAKQHKFNLLIISQSATNNPQSCFNWFSQLDNQKGQGELLSIRHIIDAAKTRQNAKTVYLVGLSAGGAMASNFISHYPSKVKGAALIAAIPFPCANDLIQAIACMKSGPNANFIKQRTEQVSEEIDHLVIISSRGDAVVNHKNSQALTSAWTSRNKQAEIANQASTAHQTITQWRSEEGQRLHFVELDDLSHGMPVNPSKAGGGSQGPYFLSNQFSAALYLVDLWKL